MEEARTLLKEDPIHAVIPYQLGTQLKPEEQTREEADTYVARMNYFAVEAMLARVYLAMGWWKEAREKALEVVDAPQFRLLDYASALAGDKEEYWDLLFSDEHIFSLKNKSLPDWVNATLNQSNPTGSNMQLTAEEVKMLYPDVEDLRREKWFDPMTGRILKYSRNNTKRFSPKVPLIRLAEMYFIIAETWLEEGNEEKAREYLDILRDHRIRDNKPLSFLSKESLITEMRREFMAEGHYFFMYKRMNHAILTLSAQEEVQPSDAVFVFPVPEVEITNANR